MEPVSGVENAHPVGLKTVPQTYNRTPLFENANTCRDAVATKAGHRSAPGRSRAARHSSGHPQPFPRKHTRDCPTARRAPCGTRMRAGGAFLDSSGRTPKITSVPTSTPLRSVRHSNAWVTIRRRDPGPPFSPIRADRTSRKFIFGEPMKPRQTCCQPPDTTASGFRSARCRPPQDHDRSARVMASTWSCVT